MSAKKLPVFQNQHTIMGDLGNSTVEFHPKKPGMDRGDNEGDFGMTVDDLCSLMELRGHEALQKIQESYTDTETICHRLKTSPADGE